MTVPAHDPPTTAPDRALLDRIFGDVLPDTTRDERGSGPEPSQDEQWYRENRPPHHGG